MITIGDRRNIVVKHDDTKAVALYSHWGGSELPQVLAKGLERGRNRWTDPTYLTRILFSEMIADSGADALMGITGLGIEPVDLVNAPDVYCEASPGYDLFVDIPNMTVEVGDDTFTFEAYVTRYVDKV